MILGLLLEHESTWNSFLYKRNYRILKTELYWKHNMSKNVDWGDSPGRQRQCKFKGQRWKLHKERSPEICRASPARMSQCMCVNNYPKPENLKGLVGTVSNIQRGLRTRPVPISHTGETQTSQGIGQRIQDSVASILGNSEPQTEPT